MADNGEGWAAAVYSGWAQKNAPMSSRTISLPRTRNPPDYPHKRQRRRPEHPEVAAGEGVGGQLPADRCDGPHDGEDKDAVSGRRGVTPLRDGVDDHDEVERHP